MHLLSLNEDCWHLICEFLTLEDKVSLANTCQFLRAIIKDNLRLNKSIKVDQKIWHQLCRYETNLESFMHCLSRNVQQLELNGMNHMQFEIAKNMEFPKIASLNIKHVNTRSIRRPDEALIDIIRNTSQTLEQLTLIDCFWHDLNLLRNCDFPKVTSVRVLCKFDFVEDYEKITEIFPQVKKLSIMAPVTSKTLWNLKSLNELEITLDEYTFSIISFITDPALDRLRLRKLSILKNHASCNDRHRYFDFINFLVLFESIDELQIDCHATLSLSFFLLQRKKVRKIIFTYENLFFCNCGHDWLWTDIIASNKFRGHIESLTINSFLLRKCPNLKLFLKSMVQNLKRLTIFDKYSTGENEFRHDRLDLKPQLLDDVPNFIINALAWHNSVEEMRAALLEMIATCELLECFEVSANICDLQFLRDVIEVARWKNKPLTLRCFNTKISANDLKGLSLPTGLQVELKHKEFELPEIDSVEIEFTKSSIDQEFNDFMGLIFLPY